MSFKNDFLYLQLNNKSYIAKYNQYGIEGIMTSKPVASIYELKAIFKYLIYIDTPNKAEQIEKLLQYYKANFPESIHDFIHDNKLFTDDNNKPATAIEYAILAGQSDIVQLFANESKQALASEKDDKKRNLIAWSLMQDLMFALKYHLDINIFHVLIDGQPPASLNQKFSVRLPSGVFETNILTLSLIYDANPEVFDKLLEAGCNPNALAYVSGQSMSEMSPIMFIIGMTLDRVKKNQLITSLNKTSLATHVENPLTLRGSYGNRLSPLMRAANLKDVDALQILLDFPVVQHAINDIDSSGHSALFHAMLGVDDSSKEEKSKAIIKTLIEHGADLSILDTKERNLFMLADINGNLTILGYLLDTMRQTNPAQLKNILDQQDNDGYTVLMYLMLSKEKVGIKKIIEKILDHCDSSIFSKLTRDGRSVLDIALENQKQGLDATEYDEVVTLLRENMPINEAQQKLMDLKNASHILGFNATDSDKVNLELQDNQRLEVIATGFQDKYTLPLMVDILDDFVSATHPTPPDFDKIKQAFELTKNAYRPNTDTIDEESLYTPYLKDQMIVIPSGWYKHSITLVLYKNKIMMSNRGEGKHSDGGVVAFELQDNFVEQIKADKQQFIAWIHKLQNKNQYTLYPAIRSVTKQSYANTNTVLTVDLTGKNSEKPSQLPLLTLEWEDFRLYSGKHLPKENTPNSYFLSSDALYQIDNEGNAQKIVIDDLHQFIHELRSTLKINVSLSDVFSFINKLPSKDFNTLQQLIIQHGGNTGPHVRRKKISYYHKTFETGDAVDVYPENTAEYVRFTRYLEGTVSLEEQSEMNAELLGKHITPFVSFPSKSQKHKTCSFVNKKSAIESMLYFLHCTSDHPTESEMDAAKQYSRSSYKQFTEKMRDRYVDKLIQDLKDPKKVNHTLVILGKVLLFDIEGKIKPAKLNRQLRIAQSILCLNETMPNDSFKQFIDDQIASFKQNCIARRHVITQNDRASDDQRLWAEINSIFLNLLPSRLLTIENMNEIYQLGSEKIGLVECILATLSEQHLTQHHFDLLLQANTNQLRNINHILSRHHQSRAILTPERIFDIFNAQSNIVNGPHTPPASNQKSPIERLRQACLNYENYLQSLIGIATNKHKDNTKSIQLAKDKLVAIVDLSKTLETSFTDAQKLDNFRVNFMTHRKLLEQRRDNAGQIFLKIVATVFSLGLAAAFGLWQVRGVEAVKEMVQCVPPPISQP